MKTRYSLLTWLVIVRMTLALLGPLSSTAAPARPASWIGECIDRPKSVSSLTERSRQLVAAGRARLAYGGDHLYYAWCDAGSPTWHRETVDPAVGVGAFASLALDVDGYPHIACQDSINGDLKYAYQDALGWHIETVARSRMQSSP